MAEEIEEITIEQIEDDIRGGDKRTERNIVLVTMDTVPHRVRAGRYIVKNFKRLVGVDPTYQLDQVIGSEFKELQDDAKIVIKGGEVFVSHVRGGGAS